MQHALQPLWSHCKDKTCAEWALNTYWLIEYMNVKQNMTKQNWGPAFPGSHYQAKLCATGGGAG